MSDTTNPVEDVWQVGQEHLNEGGEALRGIDVPERAREAFKLLRDNLGSTRQAAASAGQAAKRHDSDDMTPEEGKRRLRSEAMTKARETVSANVANAQTALTVLERDLERAALPQMPDSQRGRAAEQIAREDLRLALDPLEPDAVPDALAELAAQGGPVGALAAGDFGKAYLRQRGHDVAAHQVARAAAIKSAADSDDRSRRRAARALAKLGNLRKAADAYHHAAAMELDEVDPAGRR